MKYIVSLLFLTLALSGCTGMKPGCIIKDKVSALATGAIVDSLECSNSFAVKADMDKLFGEQLGLCKTGPIADMVCPVAAKTVADFLVKPIPEEWMCKATQAKSKVASALEGVCRKIPVSDFSKEE